MEHDDYDTIKDAKGLLKALEFLIDDLDGGEGSEKWLMMSAIINSLKGKLENLETYARDTRAAA